MSKKYSIIFTLLFISIFNIFLEPSLAIDLDEATRTVVVDSNGTTTVLTPEQVKRGNVYFMQLVELVMLVELQRQIRMSV